MRVSPLWLLAGLIQEKFPYPSRSLQEKFLNRSPYTKRTKRCFASRSKLKLYFEPQSPALPLGFRRTFGGMPSHPFGSIISFSALALSTPLSTPHPSRENLPSFHAESSAGIFVRDAAAHKYSAALAPPADTSSPHGAFYCLLPCCMTGTPPRYFPSSSGRHATVVSHDRKSVRAF